MRTRQLSTTGRAAHARGLVSALTGVALVLGCALAAATSSQAAPTAAGIMPAVAGTPEPGRVVFVEDFQNVVGQSSAYSGTGGTYTTAFPGVAGLAPYVGNTYTGSADWINGAYCNGMILARDSGTAPTWALSPGVRCSNSNSVQSWNHVRLLALAMGQEFGGAGANFVYSSYSECNHSSNPASCPTIGSGTNNGVLWQTVKPIPLPGPNRYMTFTVDTAAFCYTDVGNPTYQFAYSVPSVTGQATTWTNLGNTVGACTSSPNSNTQTNTRSYALTTAQTGITFSSDFSSMTKTIRLNRMSSDQAVKLAGHELHAKMFSTSGVTAGNDGAFDNVTAVDVTPKLDKVFTPAVVNDGQTSTLRFTITNTSELNAKTGWNFTDNLPAGLTATGVSSTTCLASSGTAGTKATVTAAAGAGTVVVEGSLAKGSASCTVDVQVKAWSAAQGTGVGIYSNGPGNFTPGTTTPACWDGVKYGLCGLDAPDEATLTVNPVVDLSIAKDVNSVRYTAGQQLTYTVTVSNAASTSARPVSTAKNVVVTDQIPARVTNATWTCSATGGATCGAASGTGNITDTVTVPPGASVVYTVTGKVAAGDTEMADIVNTAKAVPPVTMPYPPTPGSTDPETPFTVTDDNCKPGVGCEATVTTPRSDLAVTKSADPASGTAVGKGQTVRYTLTFDYAGTAAADVDYTDDLRGVLDDATFVRIVSAGGLTVTGPAGGIMRITGTLRADTTVVYEVVVKDDGRGDNLLRNLVVEGAVPAGPDAPCTPGMCTEHPVRYLYVEKVGDGAGRLDGAEFVLRADDHGEPGVVLTTPSLTRVGSGLFLTGGIHEGTYWLEETKAPEGFQLLATAVRFEVADDGTVTLLNAGDDEPQVVVSEADDGMSTVTVTDRRAFGLPLTGGAGGAVFWISGGLLLAAAGYLVVRRRTTGTSRNQVREACM